MNDMDFGAYLERAARLFPNHPAVRAEGEQLSYGQLLSAASRLAAGFTKLGLQPGDRVVELRHNCVDSVIFEYGIALAGLVRVPLTPRLMPAELPRLIAATGARAMCTTSEQHELAAAVDVEFLIADGLDGAVSREEISIEPSGERWRAEPDDLVALRHTGGTTGVPKAAMQTHAAQIATAVNVLLEMVDLTEHDRVLNTQPYTHGGGITTLPAAMRGACLLLQPRFDADLALDAIEAERATVMKIVPTILYRLLAAQRERERDMSSLRLISYGAAPMPEQLLREAMDVFDCDFSQTYGSAEAPATISCLGPREHRREREKPGTLLRSVGRPYPMADVAIVDPDLAAEVAEGEIGEVAVRGNFITLGYWQRPDLNKDLLKNGRVHTGDLGYLRDGYLYLVGRRHDVIITGGFNVYPAEVEQALIAIAGVADAGVTAVPDDEWGDRVVAAVVLDDGSELSIDQLRSGCRDQLAGYKCPKEIKIVDALPLTANSKLDRTAVRNLFASE